MTFWVLAVAIGALAAAYICWPLLKERAAVRNYALALVALVPLAAIGLYQSVGTPAGIGISGSPTQASQADNHPGQVSGEIDGMIANLERRLQDNPADLEGWVLLGRTYKTTQEYARAESALLRAAQLAPDDPLVLVELAEASMFTSRSPTVSDETKALLERALTIDPDQQKGLWLLGIAAAQDGNDALAIQLWERLGAQLEPGSPTLDSVQQQIAQLRERSGLDGTAQAQEAELRGPVNGDGNAPDLASGWQGLRVDVQAPEGLGELPANAALFVIVRNPAMPNPPLGVARLARPAFPATAMISDANSMMQELPISSVAEVQVVARLSMNGNPIAQPGDLQSQTLRVELGQTGKVELRLAAD
jgi:cytochrome c-type biogenesis protein CcmH